MNWQRILKTLAPLVAIAIALGLLRPRRKAPPLGSRNPEDLNRALTEITIRHGISLPSMFVDSVQLDCNIEAVKKLAARHGKTVRIATKSIRVPALLKRILVKGAPEIAGLMCYCVKEAHYLYHDQELNGLLVAYPTCQRSDVVMAWEMTQAGVDIALMVDSIEQVDVMHKFIQDEMAKGSPQENFLPLKLCIDVDMSYRLFDQIHLGVQRSSCRSLVQFDALVKHIAGDSRPFVLHSVMGYEAQLTIPDLLPNSYLQNYFRGLFKSLSFADVVEKRQEIRDYLVQNNIAISYFNGGGSATALRTLTDLSVTELTVGSGFFQSHIFDYHQERMETEGALAFGLAISRKPEPGVYTMQSGGFIASGTPSVLSNPTFLDESCDTFPGEGFGEVQTPFTSPHSFTLGQPVFFRPAKAGEIAEHFKKYYLVDLASREVIAKHKTYRGDGKRFF